MAGKHLQGGLDVEAARDVQQTLRDLVFPDPSQLVVFKFSSLLSQRSIQELLKGFVQCDEDQVSFQCLDECSFMYTRVIHRFSFICKESLGMRLLQITAIFMVYRPSFLYVYLSIYHPIYLCTYWYLFCTCLLSVTGVLVGGQHAEDLSTGGEPP